jgi:hypothetical protein
MWEASIAKAQPLVEYLIGHHADRFDLKTTGGKLGFVDAVMPSIVDIEDPLRRDLALGEVRRISGIDERVLRQSLERRVAAAARLPVGPGASGAPGSRITADAVLASPDALPIGDILRAVTPVEAELLRLLLVLPDQQLRVANALGPDQLPSTLARELFRTLVLQRAPDDQGVHPPFDRAGLLLALDDETRSLAQAVLAQDRPAPEAREIDRLLLDLEDDRIRERSDYNESALAEAERAGDSASIDRLLAERRQINDTRRSIDRRREDTRLLARPVAGRP